LAHRREKKEPQPTPREAIFHPEFREDFRYWVETDCKVALRVLELVEFVLRAPFAGFGKPQPLRHVLAGCCSRRVTGEHRLVYLVRSSRVDFLQSRYHYSEAAASGLPDRAVQ
jgi:toxin YoeB